MEGNAKYKLKEAISELSSAQDHLNIAYKNAIEARNKSEIHAALESVNHAIESAQNTLENYID